MRRNNFLSFEFGGGSSQDPGHWRISRIATTRSTVQEDRQPFSILLLSLPSHTLWGIRLCAPADRTSWSQKLALFNTTLQPCIHICTPATILVRALLSLLTSAQFCLLERTLTFYRMRRDHERAGRMPRPRISVESIRQLQSLKTGGQQVSIRRAIKEERAQSRDRTATAGANRVSLEADGPRRFQRLG